VKLPTVAIAVDDLAGIGAGFHGIGDRTESAGEVSNVARDVAATVCARRRHQQEDATIANYRYF
jgi:hypothetical protein